MEEVHLFAIDCFIFHNFKNSSPLLEVNNTIRTSVLSSDRFQPTNTLKMSLLSPNRIQPPDTNTLEIFTQQLKCRRSDFIQKIQDITIGLCVEATQLEQHAICGDGSCLYHPIAHQAGFIEQKSQGNPII